MGYERRNNNNKSSQNLDIQILNSNIQLYESVRTQVADFAYDCQQLNTFMVNTQEFIFSPAITNQNDRNNEEFTYYHNFTNMMRECIISLVTCSKYLVEVWKNSDWKTEECQEMRRGFLKILKEWINKCGSRLSGLQLQEKEIDKEYEEEWEN